MDILEWAANNGPALGVSVFFIVAWWYERKDRLASNEAHMRDLRRCVGFEHDEVPNGDES